MKLNKAILDNPNIEDLIATVQDKSFWRSFFPELSIENPKKISERDSRRDHGFHTKKYARGAVADDLRLSVFSPVLPLEHHREAEM